MGQSIDISQLEVSQPILNSPFEKPAEYWYIQEGEQPQRRPGRRPAVIFAPKDKREEWTIDGTVLRSSKEYPFGFELGLVSLIRQRLEAWQQAGYPGVTRTTLELIQWLRRDGRESIKRQFFCQME